MPKAKPAKISKAKPAVKVDAPVALNPELVLGLKVSALESRLTEVEGDLRRLVEVLAKDAGGQYRSLLDSIVNKIQGSYKQDGPVA